MGRNDKPMQALTQRTVSDNYSIHTDQSSSALQIKKALSKISLKSQFRLNIAK